MQAEGDTTENYKIMKAVEKMRARLLLTKPCNIRSMSTNLNYVQGRCKTDKSINFPLQTQQMLNFWSCGTKETNIGGLDKRAGYTKKTDLCTAVPKQVKEWAQVYLITVLIQ